MSLHAGIGNPVFLSGLFDVTETEFINIPNGTLVAKANPARVAVMFNTAPGAIGNVGVSTVSTGAMGFSLPAGGPLTILFSQHASLAGLAWYMVTGGPINLHVCEVVLREA